MVTDRQYQVYQFFRHYFVTNLDNPTCRDVADRFSITPKRALDHLKKLTEEGALIHIPGRGFRLNNVKAELRWNVEQ